MADFMKILKSILAFFALTFVVAAVAGLIFIRTHGKAVLEKVLTRSFKKNVDIGTLTYIPPLTLIADNLKIEDDFLAQKATVELKAGSVASYVKHKLMATPMDLEIRNLWIERGYLTYSLALSEKMMVIKARDVELVVENLTVPLKDENTSFNFKGVLVDSAVPIPGDRVEALGWVNYIKRDLEATTKLLNENGDASLTAQAQSKNNDMIVVGKVVLKSLPSFSLEEGKNRGALEEIIAQTVEAMNVVVQADFSFKTKMDAFKLEQVSFSGNVSSQ